MIPLCIVGVIAMIAAPAFVVSDETDFADETGLLNVDLRVQTSDESRVSFDGVLLVSVRDRDLAHNQNIRITGYPTEKNPEMLARIIAASSNPGDLVLDCFCGSGTTLEAAHRLGRHWLGVDNSAEAIRTTLARFAKGVEPMGDFVRRMEREDTTPSDDTMLPLFDLNIPGKETNDESGTHEPITDFTLRVAAGLQSTEVLKHWPPAGSSHSSPSVGSGADYDTATLREEQTSPATRAVPPRRAIRYSAKKAKRKPAVRTSK